MSKTISFTRDSHSKLFLPVDPFPYPFEAKGAKAILRDFLKVVRDNPAYVETTPSAFHRLVKIQGMGTERSETMLRMTGREIPSWHAFSKTFFGVEEATDRIVTGHGLQAAEGGAARKKALAITGAPGAGKSDLVNHIAGPILHSREPIPYLAGSPGWSNPLNSMYLPKLIAARKTQRRRDKMVTELTGIIERLDFSGTSELDFECSDVAAIVSKWGFDAGKKMDPAQLAELIMKSEKAFVEVVGYGLGLDKPTIDALVVPDPWVQDVVLGEFAGTAFVKDPNVRALAGMENKPTEGKRRKDDKYGRYDADHSVDLADYPLDNMFMSEGQGIVDIGEVQPINFDLKVWRGDLDISAMGLYDDRDPRTVSPTGFFNKARFGVLTEGFRNPDEGFRVILELLEGQRLTLPEPLGNFHQAGLGWEGMLIIHSNDEQWNKFWNNPDHRAHNDRLHWVSFPYPLEPKKAAEVTRKLFRASTFGSKSLKNGGGHKEPLIEDYVGWFRAATHIDWQSKGNLPFMAVLRAYDGQTVRQPGMGTELDVRTLREQAPWTEGLNGMSPRDMNDILGELASYAKREFEQGLRVSPCFTTAELRDFIIAKLAKDPRVDQKVREQWTSWLQLPLEREVRRLELSKIYKAAFIPNFVDLCNTFFKKYLDCLKALNRPGGMSASGFGSSGSMYLNTQQMEQFLQEIERADSMQVNSAQADKFRLNVEVATRVYNEEHGTTVPPYTVHEGLRRCIESYVLRQAKDITGVTGMTNLSDDEKKRLDGAKARLVAEHGYCDHCAQRLLVEVATTRDFLVA
jgi:predicted Ser/Thr protein kinase